MKPRWAHIDLLIHTPVNTEEEISKVHELIYEHLEGLSAFLEQLSKHQKRLKNCRQRTRPNE